MIQQQLKQQQMVQQQQQQMAQQLQLMLSPGGLQPTTGPSFTPQGEPRAAGAALSLKGALGSCSQ
jgi:hypothetical protein